VSHDHNAPFDASLKADLQKIAGTIRLLPMDAVQKADSGHPDFPWLRKLGATSMAIFCATIRKIQNG